MRYSITLLLYSESAIKDGSIGDLGGIDAGEEG